MPTFKSRNGWARYNKTPGSFARRKAAREAASIAGPAPAYPADAPLHGEWIGGCINGATVIFRLLHEPGHRSDQWAAEYDGVVIAQAAGLTALVAELRARLPRAQPKRAATGLQQGYTAQDEIDARMA